MLAMSEFVRISDINGPNPDIEAIFVRFTQYISKMGRFVTQP